MSTDITFPPLCDICRYYYGPADCPPGVVELPGIGYGCRDCARHAARAHNALKSTSGIGRHMLPNHFHRNNHRGSKS